MPKRKKRSERRQPEGTILHKCTENDNQIYLSDIETDGDGFPVNGQIEVGSALEDHWLVIGFKDLAVALDKAGVDINNCL